MEECVSDTSDSCNLEFYCQKCVSMKSASHRSSESIKPTVIGNEREGIEERSSRVSCIVGAMFCSGFRTITTFFTLAVTDTLLLFIFPNIRKRT